MIKPGDIHIGNWLLYNDRPVQVLALDPMRGIPDRNLYCSVTIDQGEVYPDYAGKWLNHFHPIPLTPEWMERMGFAWDKENEVFTIQVGNAIYLEVDKDYDCAITPEHLPGGGFYTWSENKHVHKLQNLYRALTGRELQIKMP